MHLCNSMRRTRNAGLSLPVEWMTRIDENRGDIPRSKYFLRLLEKAYSKEMLQQLQEKRVYDSNSAHA